MKKRNQRNQIQIQTTLNESSAFWLILLSVSYELEFLTQLA